MTHTEDFHRAYSGALRSYLADRNEASLAVGHELGRRALAQRISMLDIVENHFTLVDDPTTNLTFDKAAALQFLLQTLAALDIATRGFLDGTRRYEQQRARAQDLADRDEFRSALVNSLQEGFFVADRDGAIVEINDAFAEITGYHADGLPYRSPYPWTVDETDPDEQLSLLAREGNAAAETPIRHRDGHLLWVAVSINAVAAHGADRDAYVGTIRDITAARAAAAREHAVARLATAVSVAKDVAEVLSITLDECRSALDLQRVVAAIWPPDGAEPTIAVAGEPAQSAWVDLDPFLRDMFEDARHRLPLTAAPVGPTNGEGRSRGIVAALSGAGDLALWLEHSSPRRISPQDTALVTALVGHLSLAMQHVRQFEMARHTSLTLQRSMLSPKTPPAGFAVRYEPAVPPLEIGGDWYEVVPVDDRRIGIIVGDCVGRGLPAAAVMGQLHSSARALVLTGAEPAVLLEQLDAAAALIPGAFCTTVFMAILDVESGLLCYSSAGHLPAVLSAPRSQPTLLTDALSVPLAVRRTDRRPQATALLTPGSTLMVYTDGLVERRHQSIDDGISCVAEIVSNTTDLPADAVADTVLATLGPPRGFDDDVAIVVYRRPPAPLHIADDALADRLSGVRHRLTAWLRAASVPEPLATDIVFAVNEACTNSVEHAYRGHEPGQMRMTSEIIRHDLHVRVADDGSWKTPAADPGHRGRGLPLIRAVSDRIDLDCAAFGTTIDMTFSLDVNRMRTHPAVRAAAAGRTTG